MLLAAQAHQRGIALSHGALFRTWLKLGRSVSKGETALRILAPITIKKPAKPSSEQSDEQHVFVTTAFVFDASHTDFGRREPACLEPPHKPLTGDSHAHLLAPLCRFAKSLGYSVSFKELQEGPTSRVLERRHQMRPSLRVSALSLASPGPARLSRWTTL